MSDYIIYNGELMHYGVLGMRWGHRKAISNTKNKRKTITNRINSKIDKTDKIKSKKLKKAGKIAVTAAVAAGKIYALQKIKNSDAIGQVAYMLAKTPTKFDKKPSGRLAREAIRQDRINKGMDYGIMAVQGYIGAIAINDIYKEIEAK